MVVPHTFPSLIDEAGVQAVLIVGTGLSAPTAPTVEGLKSKLDAIAIELSIDPNESFYKVAENILNCLVTGGKPEPESRLWLAEKLGLLDDRHWFGEVGLPLSGNTPRHRVIARFAVEGRIKAIVSLNWDTLLETALDSVGLASNVRTPRPWGIKSHVTVVENSHVPRLSNASAFPVIKPHGCVRELEQARKILRSTGTAPPVSFKLKQSELDILLEGQNLVDHRVQVYIAECPLIAVGWRASESYLRETVVNTAQDVKRIECDAFTLISRSWYPKEGCDDTFHDEIAAAYDKSKLESFTSVGNTSSEPTSDCIFQWLQARYALNKLIAVASNPQKIELQKILQQIEIPDCKHFIYAWADSWLPVWVRLCWRAGVIQGANPDTGLNVISSDIPITPRDMHVPLGGMQIERRELRAAAKLLCKLGGNLNRFNFEKFLGGLWDEAAGNLYIPLPAWKSQSKQSDLAALKPLAEALRGLGFVKTIYLVWLDHEDTAIDEKHCKQISAQLSGLMPLTTFAKEGAMNWIDLETLKGCIDE